MIIGVGIDIVSVQRVAELRTQEGERFLNRVFTRREVETAGSRARLDERLATRFAAKEAAMKALGTGWREGIHFTQIEVRKHQTGQPEILLSGQALQRAEELGVTRIHVSLTHDADRAVAVVIMEGDPGANDPGRTVGRDAPA